MDVLEAHIAGLAELVEPARRARSRELLANERGRLKIRRQDIQRGEVPFEPSFLGDARELTVAAIAGELRRLGAVADVCLWSENDEPELVELTEALTRHAGASAENHLISAVPGVLAFWATPVEYPAQRAIVHRRAAG
jgi:hypothetical protein